ncbi:MAG: response regulator transcription factor, partial [Syntrophorhabdaceae bacterium]|nr:response regulator transcription factor [Syntrophorhabdaceae bacterium]
VDEAGRGYELINKIQASDYDLVLLDISLPDINGLEVLKELKKKKPKLPVLVISMYPEEQYALRALKAGAQGYLTKQSAADELVLAVRKILSGKRYVSPAFAEQLVLDFESDAAKPVHERLSNREFQVMRMFGSGKTMKEIAEELHLSINSIRTYRVRILEKIGVKGTNELIHYAVTHGLVE